MSEMIERVARAICASHGIDPDRIHREIKSISFGADVQIEKTPGNPNWMRYVKKARVAIEAMREPTGPR